VEDDISGSFSRLRCRGRPRHRRRRNRNHAPLRDWVSTRRPRPCDPRESLLRGYRQGPFHRTDVNPVRWCRLTARTQLRKPLRPRATRRRRTITSREIDGARPCAAGPW